MGISPELFEKICAEMIAVYKRNQSQTAPARTLDFQKSLDTLKLAETLKNVLNLCVIRGEIDPQEQNDWYEHLRVEIITRLRLGISEGEPKPRAQSKPVNQRHQFLYERLKLTPETFSRRFGVDEDSFWSMLAYVSDEYQKSKRLNRKESQKYQDEKNQEAILYALRQIVQASVEDKIQQAHLRKALYSILGKSGQRAAYEAWLQPKLTFVS